MRAYQVFVPLLLVCVRFTGAIRIQTIAEAKAEHSVSRQKRAASTSTVVAFPSQTVGNGVFGADTLVFTTPCFLLHTLDIGISLRAWTQATPWNLYPVSIANSSVMTVTGNCTATNASVVVTFSGLPSATNVSSASFMMFFTSDKFSWFLANMNASITYNDTISGLLVSLGSQRLKTKGLFATLGSAYHCPTASQAAFDSYWYDVSALTAVESQLQISLLFYGLTMQPFINSTAIGFTSIESCEYTFSMGIWMALVASGIMALIVGFGISMLASISTPSRFDDPKRDHVLSVPSE